MAATAFFGQFKNNTDNLCIYCQYYSQVANDGIVLGLRQYRFFSKFVFYCKLLYNIDIDQFIVVVVDRPIYNANLLNLLSCLDMLTIFGYAHCLWLCSLAFCDIGSSCCLLVWRCSLSLDMLSVFMMPLAAAFMLSVFMMLQVLQLTVFRNAFMPLCSKFLITWQGADRHRRRWRTCRGATWRCTWARGGSGW